MSTPGQSLVEDCPGLFLSQDVHWISPYSLCIILSTWMSIFFWCFCQTPSLDTRIIMNIIEFFKIDFLRIHYLWIISSFKNPIVCPFISSGIFGKNREDFLIFVFLKKSYNFICQKSFCILDKFWKRWRLLGNKDESMKVIGHNHISVDFIVIALFLVIKPFVDEVTVFFCGKYPLIHKW